VYINMWEESICMERQLREVGTVYNIILHTTTRTLGHDIVVVVYIEP
jgi:hypothetical protein